MDKRRFFVLTLLPLFLLGIFVFLLSHSPSSNGKEYLKASLFEISGVSFLSEDSKEKREEINLGEVLQGEETPSKKEDSPEEEEEEKSSEKIEINSASKEELQKITGIGPVYAERIEKGRPFCSLEELERVHGIGEVTISNIKEEDFVYINPPKNCLKEERKEKEEKDKEEETLDTAERKEFLQDLAKNFLQITEKEESTKELEKEPKEEPEKIEINSASREELEKITGIGPAYAERIEKERPFCSLEDLKRVKGIGKETIKNIKERKEVFINPQESCFEEKEEEEEKNEEEEKRSSARKDPSKEKEEDPPEKPDKEITKVEINSASEETLEHITGIGTTYARRIKENRPFCSLGELERVKGIGEVTIRNIKEEGIAYVKPPESCDEKEEDERSEEEESKEPEKIEINSASREELQKITGIGPAYAERIEEQRPFCSLEELTKVHGIGEVTVENIKKEGVAFVKPFEDCKEEEEEKKEEEEEITKVEINSANKETLEKITGIGPAYAENIIETRPFCSLTELTKVHGIGKATLEKIKEEGIAYLNPPVTCEK